MPFFFSTLFRNAEFQPGQSLSITYKDRTLHLWDVLSVQDGERLRLVFESVNSDWRQGVELDTNVGLRTKGGSRVKGWFIGENGEKVRSPTILWQDEAPEVVEFTVRTRDGKLYVNNVWQEPPAAWAAGITHIGARGDGAAMILEELPNGRRYRCNDGEPDEDFDDIIFRIERVETDK